MNIKKHQHDLEYRETPIPHFVFPAIEATGIVSHMFSTRLGGVSEGHLSSLNLSFSRGDKIENVLENYRRVGQVIGCELKDFVTSDQTHTTNVRLVTKNDKGLFINPDGSGLYTGPDEKILANDFTLDNSGCRGYKDVDVLMADNSRSRGYKDVDGLITNEPGVCLSTFYADCVPLYFVDPVHRAIGLSHSGWRGTVGRMGQKTLEAMKDAFGTDPADVICAIGPSICQDCYEVSGDVAEEFIREFGLDLSISANDILYPTIPGKYQLGLWAANRRVFLDAGVRPENIYVTDVCTCCNPELLFSHRASHGMRGNLGAFMMLK